MMSTIPVNIISGFLGSGKTTSIIRLLKQQTANDCWAIVINEFGKISIDSETLNGIHSDRTDLFDISGGCICCSAKIYFKEDLEKVVQAGKYNRIIIEPSGLGGIDMVSEIVNGIPLLQLMPTIGLVDITGIPNHRLQLNPIYQSQIRKASIIAFTKCDLLNDEQELNGLIDQFKKTFPDKQTFVIKSDEDFCLLFSAIDFLPSHIEGNIQRYFYSSHELTDQNYREEHCSFEPASVFDLMEVAMFFQTHPAVVRSKGYIKTKSGWHFYNYTMTGFDAAPCDIRASNLFVVILLKQESGTTLSLQNELKRLEIPFIS